MGDDVVYSEAAIQAAILLYVGKYYPRVRLWRANTGAAVDQAGNYIRFGIRGQSDLTGIVEDGRRLEIEVKTKRGRPSEHQVNFLRMIERLGGISFVARSVKDVEDRFILEGIKKGAEG